MTDEFDCDPANRWCGSLEPHGFHIWTEGDDEFVCDGDESTDQ